MAWDQNDTANVISGAIPVVGSVIGGLLQKDAADSANAKNREWQIQDRNWQHKADYDKWVMQNEYNSPKAQMQRLRDAGINPNMAYGGVSNVSSRYESTPQTRAVANPEHVPDYGNAGASALAAYQSTKIGRAQVSNLEAQNTNIMQDTLLKMHQQDLAAANTNATNVMTPLNAARTTSEVARSNSLLPYDLSFRQEETRKLQADTKLALTENELRIASSSANLRESAIRILESRSRMATGIVERSKLASEISRINADTDILKLDADLKRRGIQPHDALWQRTVAGIVNPSSPPVKSMVDNARSHYETQQRMNKFSNEYRKKHTFSIH